MTFYNYITFYIIHVTLEILNNSFVMFNVSFPSEDKKLKSPKKRFIDKSSAT